MLRSQKPADASRTRYSLPHLPWGFSGVPQIVEVLELTVSIHREEETVVAIGSQLPLSCQLFHRLPLQDAIVAGEIVEELTIENEEPGADPSFQDGLLQELQNIAFWSQVHQPKA